MTPPPHPHTNTHLCNWGVHNKPLCFLKSWTILCGVLQKSTLVLSAETHRGCEVLRHRTCETSVHPEGIFMLCDHLLTVSENLSGFSSLLLFFICSAHIQRKKQLCKLLHFLAPTWRSSGAYLAAPSGVSGITVQHLLRGQPHYKPAWMKVFITQKGVKEWKLALDKHPFNCLTIMWNYNLCYNNHLSTYWCESRCHAFIRETVLFYVTS